MISNCDLSIIKHCDAKERRKKKEEQRKEEVKIDRIVRTMAGKEIGFSKRLIRKRLL